MLELIEKDVPIGAEIKLYLISGDTIIGCLSEVGPNFIVVGDKGSKKRFFEQMIGGWDIIEKAVDEKTSTEDIKADERSTESVQSNDNSQFINLTQRFIDAMTEDELSFIFAPNAKIISADKKYVVIRTNDTGDSFSVPLKYIASKGIISDIETYFFSGEESQNTSIPVYVGFYYRDKTPVYPNLVLEPGTMREYCTLLTDSLLASNSQINLAKNLLFILWRGCKNKKSKEALKLLQSSPFSTLKKDFLSEIDEQIKKTVEKGQDINPLLTRKAQWLSSKNRYHDAADAYVTLIDSLLKSDNASPQSISHNYTQLALLQMRLNDFVDAEKSVHSALDYNQDNEYAQKLLKKLDSPVGLDHDVIESFQSPISRISEYTDSVLKDDLNRHSFLDPEARSNQESMTIIVAERLLSQAEAEESQDSYLEAAKAFSLIQVYEDEDITNYAKAMFGYASSRAKILYNFLINKNHPLSAKDLTKHIDGAYCYFVSAINFGSILGQAWSTLFRDYLRMRGFSFALQHGIVNANEIFELTLDEFIKRNNLQENLDYLLECSEVLISLGARCPIIKENLRTDSGKSVSTIIELLNSLSPKEQFGKRIVQINRCPHIKFDDTAENLIAQLIDYRVKKLSNLKSQIILIRNKSTEALFEANIAPVFKKLRKSANFLTTTDQWLSIEAERLMGTLSIFKSRTPDERRILAPSIKAEISNNLEQIETYSSYLCSDLLRDLWNQLLKSGYLSINEASFALQSELKVSSDGNIITNSGGRVIPISISNEGRSTIDKFKAIVKYSELTDSSFEYNGRHLSPGDAETVLMEVPKAISNLSAYDFTVAISGLILNTWSAQKVFNLTASTAENVSFKLSDIKWDFQAKETRVDMFKGRSSDIERLIATFTTTDRRKIPVVFGLTRTGKSSILFNLKKSLEKKTTEINSVRFTIVPVYIDLSAIKSQYNDHESFMLQLRIKCSDELAKIGWNLQRYKANSLIEIINFANSRKIYPIFMFDEFSWVTEVIKVEGNEFLKSIREYAIEQKAGFIYAGTYDILDIIRDPILNPSGAFMTIDEYKIYNLKNPKDAESLMRVMEPQLTFTAPAIKAIHDYSGDVPYWIQMICHYCARYACTNNRPVIGMKELEDVIKGILGESPCNGINMVSDLIIEEQQILSSDPKETKALLFSIAYLMKDINNKNGVSWNRLKEFWEERNYYPNMESVVLAKQRLEDRLGLLSQEIDGNRIYRFSVGLFRRWCARKDVFSEFDRTNNK